MSQATDYALRITRAAGFGWVDFLRDVRDGAMAATRLVVTLAGLIMYRGLALVLVEDRFVSHLESPVTDVPTERWPRRVARGAMSRYVPTRSRPTGIAGESAPRLGITPAWATRATSPDSARIPPKKFSSQPCSHVGRRSVAMGVCPALQELLGVASPRRSRSMTSPTSASFTSKTQLG